MDIGSPRITYHSLIMTDKCAVSFFFFFLVIKLLNMTEVRGLVAHFIISPRAGINKLLEGIMTGSINCYIYMKFSTTFDDKLNDKCVEFKEEPFSLNSPLLFYFDFVVVQLLSHV